MPNFFFYSDAGDGLFLARRLESEGHRVRVHIHDSKAKLVYRGILSSITNDSAPKQGEIVIFDMVKHGALADSMRRRGYKVIGASRFADSLELNRPGGAEVMRSIGIRIPETHVFDRLSEGQSFLRKQAGKWYFKPSGDQSTASTFNAEPEMLIRWIEYVKRDPPKVFELQRGMEGTEISLEGWFDGKKWVLPFNSTIEDKKFLTGDKGPRTGCMSNLVWAYEETRPTLALKTITRLAPFLERAGYVGPVDLNMILNKEGEPYGLEWSPRFGYDALHALCMLTGGDLGHQLASFAAGTLDSFSVRDDTYALTLTASVPPFPDFEHARDAVGVPLDPRLLSDSGVYVRDVMLGENGLVVAGADGAVATFGAVGTQIAELRKEVVERANTYQIPNAQFRIDPVERAEAVLTALSSLGYDKPAVRVIDEPNRPVGTYREPKAQVPSSAGKTPDFGRPPKATIPTEGTNNWDMPTFG